MELVIEVISRSNKLHDKLIVKDDSITIGRAFDNDVIIEDPHVSAHHASIEIDQSGKYIIYDLDSINGLSDLNHKKIQGSSSFESGDGFILGKTHIRIYKKSHPVAPAIKLTSFEKVLNILGKPVVCVGLVILVFASSMLSVYMNSADEIKWAEKTLIVIFVQLLMIMWAVAWSVIARIKKQDMRLMTQISVIMLFSLSLIFLKVFINWISFHYGATIYVEIINQTFMALFLFTLIWLNLYLSIFQASLKRLGPAMLLAILCFGLKYMIFDLDSESFKPFASDFSSALFPPSVTVYSVVDKGAFIHESSQIFENTGSLKKR